MCGCCGATYIQVLNGARLTPGEMKRLGVKHLGNGWYEEIGSSGRPAESKDGRPCGN